jgi:hypothetical protein
MLWSLSGNISIVHKVLFGARFNANSLSFEPFVPQAMAGTRSLSNFKYRGAVLNIEMEGYGNKIKSFSLDGKVQQPIISATLTGTHSIKIILADNANPTGKINKVNNYFSLPTPTAKLEGNKIVWEAVKEASYYKILQNGKAVAQVTQTSYAVPSKTFAEYAVIAVDANKVESFASEPLAVSNNTSLQVIEMENIAGKADYPYKGFMGNGFSEISTTINKVVSIPFTAAKAGVYMIVFRYANGNGPTNTENKCAVRTLKIDGIKKGIVLFPQRGKLEWSNWGESNPVNIKLTPGKHTLTLSYEPANENMNGLISQAMLDNVNITLIEKSE